jgi:cbb3-type cytochrome oxidase subunit 1
VLAIRFIQTAVAFFVVGVVMGMFMGIKHDFSLQPVHAHLNLLGWVSLALIGLLYTTFPQLQRGWLPFLQYWLHTLGLVLFMTGLAWGTLPGVLPDLAGQLQVPMLVLGALMVVAAVLMLAINIHGQLRAVRHW